MNALPASANKESAGIEEKKNGRRKLPEGTSLVRRSFIKIETSAPALVEVARA